jgi:putative tricarboxylic transport membrane protein
MHGRADRLVALLLLGLAIYTVVTALQMGYWQGRIPGPGFAPFWIGVGLGLSSLAILRRRAAVASVDRAAAAGRAGTLLQMTIVTVAAVALIAPLGMVASLALLLVAMVRVLGGSWRAAAGSALVLPAAFYLVFVRWLAVPLPKGPWGF